MIRSYKPEKSAKVSTSERIVQWMVEAHQPLLNSTWNPALFIQGLDVLDTLKVYIYMSLAGVVRDGKTAYSSNTETKGNAISAVEILRQKWSGLIEKGQEYYHFQRTKYKSLAPAKCQVVFWPFQLTHVKAQVPVANALKELAINFRFLVSKLGTFSQLHDRGYNSIFGPAIWAKSVCDARLNGHRLKNILLSDPKINLPQFPFECSQDMIIEAIRSPINALIGMVLVMIATMNEVVEHIAPEVIVVGNDLTAVGRIGCTLARCKGIKTACLMHGSISGNPFLGEHLSDKLIVYGENNRRELLKAGIEHSRIEICGSPSIDNIPVQTGKINSVIKEKLTLDDKKPYVLVATSGPGHSTSYTHHNKIIQNLALLSAKHKEINIICKLHPKDKIKYYDEILKRTEYYFKIVQYAEKGFPVDIFEWLQGCSAVLTGASTVAIEAMLMDVPVVTMDFDNEISNVDFIEAGATIHVRSIEGLEDAINKVICSASEIGDVRKRKDIFIRDNFYALDGNAGLRTAEVLKGILEEK